MDNNPQSTGGQAGGAAPSGGTLPPTPPAAPAPAAAPQQPSATVVSSSFLPSLNLKTILISGGVLTVLVMAALFTYLLISGSDFKQFKDLPLISSVIPPEEESIPQPVETSQPTPQPQPETTVGLAEFGLPFQKDNFTFPGAKTVDGLMLAINDFIEEEKELKVKVAVKNPSSELKPIYLERLLLKCGTKTAKNNESLIFINIEPTSERFIDLTYPKLANPPCDLVYTSSSGEASKFGTYSPIVVTKF